MKRLVLITINSALLLLGGNIYASPMGAAFTYQGRLGIGTNVANGSFDIEMRLFDALAAGSQVAGPSTNVAVSVSNGLFTINVDLGGPAFDGNARWLGISVRTNGGGAFTGLAPRQELKPMPYALFASNAAMAVTASTVVAGGVGTASLQTGAVDSTRILDGSIGSNDLSAALLNTTFWKLLGNGGTTPGVNFLGTTDNQALELKVNGQRGFRVEPTTGSPNVIGGSSSISTWISGYPVGVTIGGGTDNLIAWPGLPGDPPNDSTIGGGIGNSIFASQGNTIGGGGANFIESHVTVFSTIGGGNTNSISFARRATIGGGGNNRIQSDDATIAGGSGNFINGGDFLAPAFGAVIGGGTINSIGQGSSGGTIAGGYKNTLMHFVDGGTIGGGATNTIWQFSGRSTIAGGANNRIGTFSAPAYAGAIGGGENNMVTNNFATLAGGSNNIAGGFGATISGGVNNTNNGDIAVVGGGSGNSASAARSTIGGGLGNSILFRAASATVSGGAGNIANAERSTIGGGEQNRIDYAGYYGGDETIGGGFSNIVADAGGSTIGGGKLNAISDAVGGYGNGFDTISGGLENEIRLTTHATIGGGGANKISGVQGNSGSTISGGLGNTLTGHGAQCATVAGGRENAIGGGPNDVFATIGGGRLNQIAGRSATIAGGEENEVGSAYGTIPGGSQAATRSFGQMAYAAGQFSQPGDAQTSMYVLRGVSTGAVETEIFLDGAAARMKVPTNSTWGFDILITGRTSGGVSAFYIVRGVVEHNGSTTSLSVTPTKDYTYEDNAAWNAIVDVDDPTDTLVIRVVGSGGATIRWVASVRVVEVIY